MNLTRTVTLPELALLAGTRGMLGAGIGLLLAPHLDDRDRRTVGRTLFLIGLATTLPLALQIFRPQRNEESALSDARSAAF